VIKAHQAENDQAGLVDAGPGFIPAAYIDSVFSGSNLYTLAWDTRAQGAAVSGFSLAWRITTTGHLIADTREWRRAFVLINLQSGGGTYEVSFNGGSSYTAAASSNGTGVAIVDSGDLGSVASRQVRVRNANGSPVDVLGYIPLKNAGTSGSVPVNLAIGGSSTSDWIGVTWWDDIIAALDAVSGAAVRKVIFDVGIADAFEAQTAAAMNGRHDTLVTRAHTAATSFITTGVTIPYRAELPPTVLAPSVPDWEATWVPAWEAVAVDANAAGRNTFLIDDYALLGDCGDGSGTIGEALLMDGLHLGARGQLVKRGNYVRSLGPAVATSSAVLTDGTRDVDGDLNVNGGLTGQSVFAQREGDADPYAGTSHFEGFGGLNGAVGLGDGSGTVDAFLAHAGASLISIIGGKITGAADGSGATDYATKGQMDTAVTGAKARANHTGTQTAATISDFSTAADARITAALAAATVAVVNDLTVGDDLLVSGDIIGIGGAYLQAVSSIIELRNIVSGLLTKARIADGTDADHAVSKGQMDTADALKMAKASNLSDVANAATAFGNIKQPASTTATGVVELATSAETITGSDTDRAVTPAGGAATYAPKAVGSAVTFTTTNGDTIEIGESDFGLGGGFRQPYIGMKKSGDVNYRWVSWGGNFLAGDGTSAPTGATAFSNIKQQATTTATGVVELATNAETETGSDTARVAPVSATEAVYLKKSLADAKGDLLVATAADTLARLAVGTNGYSLVADSAQATGTKWSNEFTKRYEGGREGYQSHGNTGTTETIDLANGNVHRCVLDNNCTFTFTGATNVEGCSFSLILVQDATGSRTATWPASVKWAAGAAPTLSTAANARDRLVFMTEDGGTTWDGALVGKGFA
jgi:lysophospholipase L1-like esterase